MNLGRVRMVVEMMEEKWRKEGKDEEKGWNRKMAQRWHKDGRQGGGREGGRKRKEKGKR